MANAELLESLIALLSSPARTRLGTVLVDQKMRAMASACLNQLLVASLISRGLNTSKHEFFDSLSNHCSTTSIDRTSSLDIHKFITRASSSHEFFDSNHCSTTSIDRSMVGRQSTLTRHRLPPSHHCCCPCLALKVEFNIPVPHRQDGLLFEF